MAAGQNLATNLELPINKAGFSKQFIRYLQMSEIFDCTKGLIADSETNNFSPIEILKRYRQEAANAKFKKPQEGKPRCNKHRGLTITFRWLILWLKYQLLDSRPWTPQIITKILFQRNTGRPQTCIRASTTNHYLTQCHTSTQTHQQRARQVHPLLCNAQLLGTK